MRAYKIRQEGVFMNLTSETIGERIKKMRKEKGLSQEELGNAIGLTQNSISKMENGDISLTIDNLLHIASFFNVTTDYICTGQRNDNILSLLEKYACIEYQSLIYGTEHFDYPVLKINLLYFEYLIQVARAKSYKLPDDVREMWLEKEIQSFNQSLRFDTYPAYIEIVPVPQKYIYPDNEDNVWEKSDLIRLVEKFYNNDFKRHESK